MTTPAPYLPFLIWLQERCDTSHDTLINEVSVEFPKEQINKLFDKEFEKAYRRVIGDSMHARDSDDGMVVSLSTPGKHLTTFAMFHDYDWCGYISRALANAGIPRHDQDSAASRIVVQLLVKPGRLFSGWVGQVPLEARWKVAVRNAVINARSSLLRDKKRQSSGALDDSAAIARSESEPGTDELVQGFKKHVRSTLGEPAERLLQHLLDGGEVKDLVKGKVLTSYRAKELVKAIKRELLSFGANDPEFLEKVKKALFDEDSTLNRRFGANRRH